MASCCSNGSSFFGVLAIAGLIGVGVAGYSYLAPSREAAKVQAVNADAKGHDGCALCPSQSEATVTLASDTKAAGECSEAKMAHCSEAKMAACSEAKAEGCSAMKACSEGEKVNAVNAANVEKVDACEGKECTKGEACCKKTGTECTDKAASGGCCSGEKKSEPAPASGGGF